MIDYEARKLYARNAYEALKPYVGKNVRLNILLKNTSMHPLAMYAGQSAKKDGDWAEFVTSREERIDGSVVFNGYWAHLWDIEDVGEGIFTIINSNRENSNQLMHLGNKSRLEQMIEMWEKRE